MSRKHGGSPTVAQPLTNDGLAGGGDPTYTDLVAEWKAEDPDFLSIDELEVPDLFGDEDEEDPAERRLLDTVLNPAESYYWQVREERGADVIDGLLSTAPNKLGPSWMVRVFNRSTGDTCCRDGTGPGGKGTLATEECMNCCYARRLEQIRKIRERYELNDRLVADPSIDFVKLMIGMLSAKQLTSRPAHYVRFDGGGEFVSPESVRQWVKIAKACYWITFWGYSRSWVRDDILAALRELHALPNVRVILSYDRVMPTPPDDFPHAYLSVADDDLPPAGDKPLVVFRAKGNLPVPKAMRRARLFVCPHQRGPGTKSVPDCAGLANACGVCLPPPVKLVPPENVGFAFK